jgi:LysM repeat protein
MRSSANPRNRQMRLFRTVFSILFVVLVLASRTAFADAFPPISLTRDQMTALLGNLTFEQDGVQLELDKLAIRFFDKVDATIPGLPPVQAVPLALDKEVHFLDFRGMLSEKLATIWATQLPHSCNDRHEFEPSSVHINRVTESDLSVSFSAYYGKYACWSYDAPKCTLSWNFQKCEMGRVSGNTLLFEKTIDYRLDLHLTATEDGIILTPSLEATNVGDIEKLVAILDFLRPILQFSIGNIVSPVVGVVFALPQVKIIPKLKGPNEVIHELGLDPYKFSLGRLKDQQAAKFAQLSLGKDAAGAVDVGPRLRALKIRSSSLSWRDGKLYMALLMVTPNEASPSAAEAELDRSGLLAIIDGLTRYQASERQPVTEYVVAKGDTMWSVAKSLYGNPYLHLVIAEQNVQRHRSSLRTGETIRVIPYHKLVDNVDNLVGNRNSSWLLADRVLGSGTRYSSIQVGTRTCGGATLIYPVEQWRVLDSPACRSK